MASVLRHAVRRLPHSKARNATDVVIGAISGYDLDTIQPWLNSLDACGFVGDKVILACNVKRQVLDNLTRRGYQVQTYAIDPTTGDAYFPEPSFQDADTSAERFRLIWHYLLSRTGRDLRYVIAVDVRDAIFQANPAKWLDEHLGDKELNVSSEALRYEDEEWNSASLLDNFGQDMYDRLRHRVVWNAGVIAGRASSFLDLCLNVHLLCRAAKLPYSDQAALNIVLSMEPYKRLTRFSASEDGWACHAGTMFDLLAPERTRRGLLEPTPLFDGSNVYTRSGKKYCVVHQYDRVPEWRESFQKRYGREEAPSS